ncbi:sugar phosphate isomerase/epimerase family protein [[Eubacterium] cellulosolvens]
MKLGFVSAIFPDLPLEDVINFASRENFSCIELMCWPKGKADRRYAGVTHIDVANFTKDDREKIHSLLEKGGLQISGLGYYPNPLIPDQDESRVYIEHLHHVIKAAKFLDVNLVNTFIGRDWTKTVEENWPQFLRVWKPLIRFAEEQGVRIGIENCPMLFTEDEWPGGKNLAFNPAIWRRMFQDISSSNFGLNYDPSHLIWQRIDYIKPLREFIDQIFHIHAKDARIDYDRLDDVGTLATPLEYHQPKIPGLGEVNWGRFFSVLGDLGYKGPVCIEVEDRAYEESLETRKDALRQSSRYLRQFIP